MSLWLTADELRALTGYKRPSDQARFLRERYGLVVSPTRHGLPVLRSAVHEAQARRCSVSACRCS